MRILLLLFASVAFGQTFTISGNFPRDLFGPVDTRPLTWGHAEAQTLPIRFKPPAGMRVRILKLRGDMTAMPKVVGDDPPVPANRYAGVLLGFSTTSSTGSAKCDWCADGCYVYIQDALHGGEAKRAPFDYSFAGENFLLDADNTLQLKIAAYLNTGVPIHVEATYTVTAEWVPAPEQAWWILHPTTQKQVDR